MRLHTPHTTSLTTKGSPKATLQLSPAILLGSQSPGIYRQEKLFETVEEAAASFFKEADELFFANRDACAPCYDLVAYCAGCSVAFEMAKQLEKVGRLVGNLTIVDSGLKHPRAVTNLSYFRSIGKRFSYWFLATSSTN